MSPLIALSSNLLSRNDMGFYVVLEGIAVGWLVLGLVLAFVRQCDYGAGRTVFVGILSLLFMLLLWGLLVLFIALCIQAVSFLTDIGQEMYFKWL